LTRAGPGDGAGGGEVGEGEFLVAVGGRLRLARLACRLSQRQVADAAGIHRTVIGRIERGEVNFGVDYLWRLAAAVGVAAGSLLPDTADRQPVRRSA
jgi:transcriptional regulator with XRE-family HTH domain